MFWTANKETLQYEFSSQMGKVQMTIFLKLNHYYVASIARARYKQRNI